MNRERLLVGIIIAIIILIIFYYIFHKQYNGYYDYSCHYKRYGCCPDGLLPKYDELGSNCYK